MVFTVSAAVLLAVIVIVLLKGGYVRFGSMLACTLFGFTLAATGLAPLINGALSSLAGLVAGL
ncbi:hypothetical protein B0675_39415 [Streptomyces sp. M41(2017)]|uniref:hypothetical protein n=1 Tax=Streptomyces sp. M41(2017) TaxID=1955065 RepID=UPI0009C0F0CC|nr:hypothetical protein [Streptomyces sp. M41(2017)]OQQ13101.1 hypothetical protein B0675_39415 [Streptomyces sp. M41(2017)]